MALEQYVNDPGTTVNATVLSGDATITVASSTGFPSTGNFRIIIKTEILLVTAVSGTTWTVTRAQESTVAAGYSVGTPIHAILTAASLNQTRYDIQSSFYLYGPDTSSSTTTYTCAMTPTLTAYTTGMVVYFKPANSNTGASTINIDALGAKSIILANVTGSALIADDLLAGGFYTLLYDGTAFRKINGPDGAWTALSYSNSWADFGSGFQVGQYRKDRNGRVFLRGLLAPGTGTSGTVIFAIPAGYRPPASIIVFSNNGTNTAYERYDMSSGGNFTMGATVSFGGGNFVSLDNLSWTVF